MLTSMETWLRQGRRQITRWASRPQVLGGITALAWGAGGFLLSGLALRDAAQPVAMGLILAAPGWYAALAALGAGLGYRVFWGTAGSVGWLWALCGWILSWIPRGRDAPVFPAALSALAVSATGVLAQLMWLDVTVPGVYLLRIAMAPAGVVLLDRAVRRRDALTQWVTMGLGVLATARIFPLPFLGLGYVAAGAIGAGFPFPAAVLGGLALDIAGITPVPMGAVLCAAYFFRLLPRGERWLRSAAPGLACLAVMAVCGVWDPAPVPGLVLGGLTGQLLPPSLPLRGRRGETGVAQVRLELAAGVLSCSQQMLLEVRDPEPDREALMDKVRRECCGRCSARADCREWAELTAEVLDHPLDFRCRKTTRVLTELSRAQEQLRKSRADLHRRQEYRQALIQQYRFLSEFLRNLSDHLPSRGGRPGTLFRVRVVARSAPRAGISGDRCRAFPGTGCNYYVLLCDGMGTGPGADEESRVASAQIQRMLTAGFPAEHTLATVNSLLALRGQAGAVTLDLAQLRLDTGQVRLYKWGAAPSYLLTPGEAEKLGAPTAPPGIRAGELREDPFRLCLSRGQTLVLLSDGVDPAPLERGDWEEPAALAQALVNGSPGTDDATAAVIRLLRPG